MSKLLNELAGMIHDEPLLWAGIIIGNILGGIIGTLLFHLFNPK